MEKEEKTVEIEIRLRLPDAMVREAEADGLLEPTSLESMLRDELRRRRVERLFEAADRLAAVGEPAMTEAEVEAEIRAVRAERRANAGGR